MGCVLRNQVDARVPSSRLKKLYYSGRGASPDILIFGYSSVALLVVTRLPWHGLKASRSASKTKVCTIHSRHICCACTFSSYAFTIPLMIQEAVRLRVSEHQVASVCVCPLSEKKLLKRCIRRCKSSHADPTMEAIGYFTCCSPGLKHRTPILVLVFFLILFTLFCPPPPARLWIHYTSATRKGPPIS